MILNSKFLPLTISREIILCHHLRLLQNYELSHCQVSNWDLVRSSSSSLQTGHSDCVDEIAFAVVAVDVVGDVALVARLGVAVPSPETGRLGRFSVRFRSEKFGQSSEKPRKAED